ncbi:hypothetical protein F5888DRAFT_1806836 [Russula emetica]|nr:hypothetical protein F5888DRAFT_1806836 [Russula emetica]
MSTAPTAPSASTSRSNFASIFNAALESYKRKTKKDLASHPLLPDLQTCESPEAVLTVLRDQVPAFNESRNSDDGLTKWVTPTVNVLYSFSETIGQGVGLAFPPAGVIFAGIGVLLSMRALAKTSLSRSLTALNIFSAGLRYILASLPTGAMSDIIVKIMVEVLTILGIATKEVKHGRIKTYFKKLTGKREIEDNLERLDKLTQEEARMASAEQLRMTHIVDGKVTGVDDRVRGVEGQVQGVRGDVQDVRVDVQDARGDVRDVGNKVQDVDDRVQRIDSNVQGVGDKLDQVNRNQLRDSLLRWLSPPNPSINHNIACKAHHNGTTQWFFQGSIFNQWKSTGSFLWVHGKPGSGKSVVCSSIVQDIMALRDAGMASMAYFYFDFRDADKQKLCNLLPSLLVQLSARSDPCCDILSQLYSAHDRGVQKPSDHAMAECLKQMLALEGQGPTYIILDALDECPITSSIPSPREEVLELVEDLPDIQIVLERLTERPVSLHDESGQKEDIVNYVSSSVHSDRRMGRWREEDKELVIKTLSEKADGMFRWVFCQLELLRQCFPPSVRRILEELPDSLDETYERILREIQKPNQGHAHRLLQCLVVAIRPLRVEELAEVLAFDFNTEGMPKLNPGWRWEDQEEAVTSACSSLVMIVKDGDSRVVQFSHFSVKEFLTADRLAEPIRDRALASFYDWTIRVDRDSIEDFPLARYAAQYWPTHARVENESSRIKEGMECLFDADKPHFATWLWIYNEDDEGDSMTTMRPEKPAAVPLYYAARFGFRDLAEHLIAEHPEHVSARGGSEGTPIHAAALAGQADILSLLIQHGADLNARNGMGQTPLFLTSKNAKLEAGQFLLNHGADIEARNEYNNTPLIYAIYGNIEFARMLLERGAVINARCQSDKTPLHRAAQRGRIEFVRLLLDHGADVNALDRSGNTPSELGLHYGHPEIVELLSEYRANNERPEVPSSSLPSTTANAILIHSCARPKAFNQPLQRRSSSPLCFTHLDEESRFDKSREPLSLTGSPVDVYPGGERNLTSLFLALSAASATLASSSLTHTFTRRDLSIVPTEPSPYHQSLNHSSTLTSLPAKALKAVICAIFNSAFFDDFKLIFVQPDGTHGRR